MSNFTKRGEGGEEEEGGRGGRRGRGGWDKVKGKEEVEGESRLLSGDDLSCLYEKYSIKVAHSHSCFHQVITSILK